MEEKNKTYTAADFARYHAGTMPPGEKHALERAALDDPFLEDALDGYLNSSTIESDIADIKQRLADKRKKRHAFFISTITQNKWWRIAALFIIIAGSGFFIYRLNFEKKENPIVQNKIRNSSEKNDVTVAPGRATESPKTDSLKIKNDIAFNDRPKSNFTKKKKSISPAKKQEINAEVAASSVDEAALTTKNYQRPLKDSFNNVAISDKELKSDTGSRIANMFLLKGTVVDGAGTSVPFATITQRGTRIATTGDANGIFSLKSKDSSITAVATATGYMAKTFALNKDELSKVELKRNATELTTVITTAARKSKYSKIAPGEIQTGDSALLPDGGIDKFNQYLKLNISPVYDDDKPLTGKVSLSFTVNKTGRPQNIKVVESSCDACEEQAIELLKNGPRWAGKKDAVGKVKIRFSLQ